MSKIPDGLTSHGYPALKRNYRMFQRRIYDALAELTPTKFQFLMSCRKEMSFNWEGIDMATYTFIGDVLVELIGDPKLVITEHDLLITYNRFRELIWKYECVRQGLMQEVKADDGSVEYVVDDDRQPQPNGGNVLFQVKRRHHWGRVKPVNLPGDKTD